MNKQKLLFVSLYLFLLFPFSLKSEILNNIEVSEEKFYDEEVLIKKGLFDQAILNLESEIDNYPKDKSLYYLLGKAYAGLKNQEKSLEYYRKSIEIDISYPKPYMGLAILKGKQGKFQDTLSLLNRAIELNPSYAEAYSNRGVTKGALSDNYGAIKDFNKAILLDPLLLEPYRNRGITYELLGDLNSACDDWKIAASLGQQDSNSWFKDQCSNRSPDLLLSKQKEINNLLKFKNDSLTKKINLLEKGNKLNKQTLKDIEITYESSNKGSNIQIEKDEVEAIDDVFKKSSKENNVIKDDQIDLVLGSNSLKQKSLEINNSDQSKESILSKTKNENKPISLIKKDNIIEIPASNSISKNEIIEEPINSSISKEKQTLDSKLNPNNNLFQNFKNNKFEYFTFLILILYLSKKFLKHFKKSENNLNYLNKKIISNLKIIKKKLKQKQSLEENITELNNEIEFFIQKRSLLESKINYELNHEYKYKNNSNILENKKNTFNNFTYNNYQILKNYEEIVTDIKKNKNQPYSICGNKSNDKTLILEYEKKMVEKPLNNKISLENFYYFSSTLANKKNYSYSFLNKIINSPEKGNFYTLNLNKL